MTTTDTLTASAILTPARPLIGSGTVNRLSARDRCAHVIARHAAAMEAERHADEAAGFLALADEPSPSTASLEADAAASIKQVA